MSFTRLNGTFALANTYSICSFVYSGPQNGCSYLSTLNKPRRLPNMPIDGHYKDIAKSAQVYLEKVALFLLKYLYDKTSSKNLCLAGGVALNVLMNQKLLESGFVNNI